MRHLIRMLGVMLAMVGLVGALGASAHAAPRPVPQEPAPSAADSSAAPAPGASAVPSLGGQLTSESTRTRLIDDLGVAVKSSSGEWVSLRPRAKAATVSRGDGTARDGDTVTQTSAHAGRIMEVIDKAKSSHEFAYAVALPAGKQLVSQPDGSVLIGKKSTKGDQVSVEVDALIAAPWALDARGEKVPVSYSLADDNTLRMTVAPAAAAVTYPIVADPTVTAGGFRATWSIFAPTQVSVYLNKARSADAADVAIPLCAATSLVPIVGPYVAIACGANLALIRIVQRQGYCQWWSVNLLNRNDFRVNLYRGGFCT
ncbi:MAG: hypothetical protein ACRCXL_04075 [Dermatophilaceae bacterium]